MTISLKSVASKTLSVTKTAINVTGVASGKIAKTVAVLSGATDENIEKAEKIGKVVGKSLSGGALGVLAAGAIITAAAPAGLAGGAAITAGLAGAGGTMIGGILLAQALAVGGAIAAGLTSDEKEKVSWKSENIKNITVPYRTGEKKIVMLLNNNNDGLIKCYLKNGILKQESMIIHEKPEGLSKEYYDNGKLRAELWYVQGKKSGLLNFYDEKGNIIQNCSLEEYHKRFGYELEIFGNKDE